MDSDHRHDLKDNDLLEFFTNFKEWWGKYGNATLLVVLVLLVALLGWRLYDRWQAKQHEEAWAGLASATSPDGMRDVAQSTSDPVVKAMGYLNSGDMLLAPASRPLPATPEGKTAAKQPTPVGEKASPAAQRKQDLAEAKDGYQKVIDNPKIEKIFKLNARLGLAAIAEDQHDWTAAHKQYETVIAQSDNYPGIKTRAQERLDMLAQLKEPVVYKPEPPAPEASAKTTKIPATTKAVTTTKTSEAPKSEKPSSATPAKGQ